MKKIFIVALVFFMSTVGISGFIFVGDKYFVSSKNVDIGVLGATTISAGEVLELGVTISNKNSADLDFAYLSIQYPQGSRDPDHTDKSLTYSRVDLGEIKASTEIARNMKVALFGLAGEVKEIKLSVEYKVKGSNATFYKDKVFEVVIGDSPIVVTVESSPKTVSGEEFVMKVVVTLNATEVLKNVVLKAEYPHGYSLIGSSQSPNNDNNLWSLGDMTPGSKKTLSIRGQLVGEDDEQRTFRFYVGISDEAGTDNGLKVVVTSFLNTVVISRPSIGLDIRFNGENVSTYIAPATRRTQTSIRFKNNLPDRLLKPRLEVVFSGAVLDKLSVKADSKGVYDLDSSKIVWNLSNNAGLAELAPGESGQVSFEFNSLPSLSELSGNHDIELSFLIVGTSVATIGRDVVSVKETRHIKVSSQVNFYSKALHSLGPFSNSGPTPPKVGEETTYAIVFSLGNTRGDLKDAKVVAHLGQGVSWLGSSNFTGEDITYDSASNTVTWNLGELSSDTGFSSAVRELPFQIAFTPSLSQIGTVPNLVTGLVFSGRDTADGEVVTVNNSPITTNLMNDPAFIQGDDIVVK
jgi:hypothetical protein